MDKILKVLKEFSTQEQINSRDFKNIADKIELNVFEPLMEDFLEWICKNNFHKYEGGFWARDNEEGKFTFIKLLTQFFYEAEIQNQTV